MSKQNIKFIIDAEYFCIDSTKLVKELGVLDVDSGQAHCRYYQVCKIKRPDGSYKRLRFFDLSSRDRYQIIWIKNYKTGLMFEDLPHDEPQENFMHYIRELGDIANGRLIAYKGGTLERDLLHQLGIPSINVETLGCPRFDQIVDTHPEWFDATLQCGRHVKRNRAQDIPKQRVTHCPRTELNCFYKWLIHYDFINKSL